MKKILLINGSPNKNGNTVTALKIIEDFLSKGGMKIEWFHIGNKPVRGCIGCEQCKHTHRCVDRLNKYFTFSQMPIVSSDYWNGYLGEKDDFGTEVLKTLAQNMLEMIRK